MRLAIPAAVLVGVALGWYALRKPGLSKPTVAFPTENRATSAAPGQLIEPSSNSPAVMPQPQAEAATIKREAVAVALELAKAYPTDALTHALLGSAYYNIGQSDEATKHLQRCLELNPGQAEAYEVLARVAYEKGNLDESIRLAQESLKRGPANPEGLNRLGRALMDLGRTDEAVETLQRAVHLPKPTSESFYLLGQGQMQSGDYLQAKESFQKTIQLLPDHTQAFFGLYTTCIRLGQTEEAERYREQFLKLEAIDRSTLTERSAREDTLTGLPLVRKTVARTIFGAAQIYRAHKENGKAVELFRKCAFLDADNPLYRAALEAHFLQRNALAEGVTVFEQLAAEQPESTLNHMFLGRMHARLEQFAAAERDYQKVQALAPQWAEGYRALAELHLRSERKPAEARVLARKVVELEPSGPSYYLLAVACAKNNDRVGALNAVKQALALNPGETKFQELLEQLNSSP